MKTYRTRESVKRFYYAVGIFFVLVAAAVFLVRPMRYAAGYQNILVYVFVVMLAALNLLRPKACRLTIDRERLCFYDGLLGRVTIRLDQISKIEWNPEIRVRVYTGEAKKRASKIPNIFSQEDTEEILRIIQKHNKAVKIIYLEPPGRRGGPQTPPEEDMESEEPRDHDCTICIGRKGL